LLPVPNSDRMSHEDLSQHTPFMRQNVRMVNGPNQGKASGAHRPTR